MAAPKPGVGPGILNPRTGYRAFDVARFEPHPDLTGFVAHFWTVSWHLAPGISHTQETLPDAAVHVAFETGASEVVGVMRGRFTRRLAGAGRVFAIKFLPGGFYPFVGRPMTDFAERRLAVSDCFDVDVRAFETRLFGYANDLDMARECERFLLERLPPPDPNVAVLRRLFDAIRNEPTLQTTADLARQSGISSRSLQRLFRRYVGLNPKWVIMRTRLFEATTRLASQPAMPLAELAADLGYTDQAHFNRDFRAVVGVTPAAYARTNRI